MFIICYRLTLLHAAVNKLFSMRSVVPEITVEFRHHAYWTLGHPCPLVFLPLLFIVCNTYPIHTCLNWNRPCNVCLTAILWVIESYHGTPLFSANFWRAWALSQAHLHQLLPPIRIIFRWVHKFSGMCIVKCTVELFVLFEFKVKHFIYLVWKYWVLQYYYTTQRLASLEA